MKLLYPLILPLIILGISLYFLYIDRKEGIVRNKYVLPIICIELLIQLTIFVRYSLPPLYLLYIPICIFLNFSLYALDIWGAGDGKLLSCMLLSYPIHLWTTISPIYMITIPALAFIFAYISSLVLFIKSILKKKIIFSHIIKSFDWLGFMAGMVIPIFVSLGLHFISNQMEITHPLWNFVILLLSFLISRKLSQNFALQSMRFKWIFTILFLIAFITSCILKINLIPFILLSTIILIMSFLSYNSYLSVPIDNLAKGMILSTHSRMMLEIAGVLEPIGSYEKISDKLTDKTINKIQNWSKEKLKAGITCPTLTVIRTIPFAPFLYLGDVVCFILISLKLQSVILFKY